MERELRAQGDDTAGAVDEAATQVPPRIDVSPALHAAGHEVHDLGFDDVPDDGPMLHADQDPAGPDDPLDFANARLPSD